MRTLTKLVALAACVELDFAATLAQVSVLTYHNDNARTGVVQETILTPANVNKRQFGKLFAHQVNGQVYAQPLYVPNVTIPGKGTHNVVYVVTERSSVYAFDADNAARANRAPLWKRSFLDGDTGVTAVSAHDDVECADLTPIIGITSTPVIDPAAGIIYVVAKTKDQGTVTQRLHALDLGTGREKPGSPVVIDAA